MSLICKLMSARLFLVTKQKWYEIFDMGDLEVRQYVAASGQSAITIKTQKSNQIVLSFKVKSIPLSFKREFSNTSKDLWKASQVAFLKSSDFLSELSLVFRIEKYPNNCLASNLLHLQFLILPIDT